MNHLMKHFHSLLLAAPLFASALLNPSLMAQAAPNAQMSVVLNQLAAIAGTPFPQLTPQDARQQFSAEDAAKIVARSTGKASAPEP
jgi:hypothetical protein